MSSDCLRNDLGEIGPWFNGRCVLVTGGTGFMGKALIEKLLRSCSGLKTIYLLIRTKRGKNPQQRIDELITEECFYYLRTDHPSSLKKLVAIAGDVTQPDLGISPDDQQLLFDNVSVVFHSAATVKFDEPLKLSVAMNIVGTKQLLAMSKKMTKLESFVHVSTAYCNCDRKVVTETVYPFLDNPDKIIKCVEYLDDEWIETIKPKILGNKPNTYTYTKAIAEQIVSENAKQLPIAIVRPSIVTAAVKEPLPGWVDNINGPTGMIAGAGKGILRTLLCYRHCRADIIPVDIAVNLFITVAWKTGTKRPTDIPIYHCTSGQVNPIRWGEIEELGRNFVIKYPQMNCVWYPGGTFKSSRLLNYICVILFHALPAYILDFSAAFAGKKPIMVKIYKKLKKAVETLEYFTTHEWEFENKNGDELWGTLCEDDRRIFNYDIRSLNWATYFEQYVVGVNRYILKEPSDKDSMIEAKAHLQKMYYLHLFAQFITMYFIWSIAASAFSLANKYSYKSWNFVFKSLNAAKKFISINLFKA